MTQEQKNKLKISINNKANLARIAAASQQLKNKKTITVETKNKKSCDCDRKG